jgi:hypothetical protein
MKKPSKRACQCCDRGVATQVYRMITVPGAAIFFCGLHLSFFKRCSGDISTLEGETASAALGKADQKAFDKLIMEAREDGI